MKKVFLLLLAVMLLSTSGASIFGGSNASAATFNQNRIIDDGIFDNTNSMNASQIDAFLNSFANSCISPNSGFKAIDPTGYSPISGYAYGGFVTAGQVIYDAAQAYGINPQVLLSTLQKEQSLVVGGAGYCNNGDEHKYAAAVGYGCPDSGTSYSYTGLNLYQRNGVTVTSVGPTCVNTAIKAGFSQQIIRAAWLLKFGEQRSKGNIGWAVIKGSWDNSDDPQTCYGGPMTQGTWQRCPSGATTYYDGYTTIDATAVHMETGSTAALYWYTPHFSGNQHFFDIFTGWFGNTTLPLAFKTPNSGAVYVQTNGYKFYVPTIDMLQDYGISSGSIQVISQVIADNIPTAASTTGLSTSLSNLVKSPSDQDSDGGSVYLVTMGKRYAITNMQQFADFGFNTSNISYLPLDYIYSMTSAGSLSNFIQTPSSNVFQVSGGSKRIIFDYATYSSLSNGIGASAVSSPVASALASGTPITNREILVRTTTGNIYLFENNAYYYVASSDQLTCWGFATTLGTPSYGLADDDFIGAINNPSPLSCSVNSQSTNYLLNDTNRITVPTSYTLPPGLVLNQDLSNLAAKISLRSSPLGQVVKTPNLGTLWYIENGTRKLIPSMSDFGLLGLNTAQIDTIANGAAASLPASGIKIGLGQVVKGDNSAAVYVVSSGSTKAVISSADDFLAYGYNWPSIESFPSAILDQPYPTSSTTLSKYLYTPPGGVYLMDPSGCYGLTPSQVDAYGQSHTANQAGQTYSYTIFPNVNLINCKNASVYVKSPNQGTVFYIVAGKKYPISSWAKLQSLSQQSNPSILTLSNSTLATLPTGLTL